MDIIGKIKDIAASVTGDLTVSLVVEDGKAAVPWLTEFLQSADRLSVKISRYRKKRSLDANAYHWTLCGKMAAALNTDVDSVHYGLMLRYGTPMDGEGGRAAVVTVGPDVDLQKCGVYGRVIGTGYTDGKICYHYMLIKPSRQYDSKEMSTLIDGTVSEAKELGIETLPPAELAEMMEALRKHEEKQKIKGVRHITQDQSSSVGA